MTEFQKRLEANIRESLRFAVGEVQEDAVAHMVAGVTAVLDHPSAPSPQPNVALPWDDAKVAFGFNDNSSNDGSIELLEEIWDESLRKSSIWPGGWELIETDTAGARMVVVFRVDGPIKPEDGAVVRKLLDRIEKLDDPRLDDPSPETRERG